MAIKMCLADRCRVLERGDVLRMILCFLICSSNVARASDNEIKRYDHYCTQNGKMIKLGGYSKSWGHLVTPGFPDSFRTPMRCSWILDYTSFTNNPGLRLLLYATQVYVKMKYISASGCQDERATNCTSLGHISSHRGLSIDGSYPYIKISLDVPHQPDVHLRVMEVHTVYGVNMTYEIAEDRQNKFNCSAEKCHFNGRCIVQEHKDGTGLYMECRCNSPQNAGPEHMLSPFHGDQCQYHGKQMHCSGPSDNHYDSLLRCNGQPCFYYTSRLVRCNCTDGSQGDRCQFPDEKDLKLQSNAKRFKLKARLPDRIELTPNKMKKLKESIKTSLTSTVCHPHHCQIIDATWLPQDQNNPEAVLLLEFGTTGPSINQKLASLQTIKIGNLKVNLEAEIRIEKISTNKNNPIEKGAVLAITCTPKVEKNIHVTWFKDGLKVETSNSSMKRKDDERYIAQNPTANGNVLHIENANKFDSGTFRCEVESEGESVALDLETPVLVSSPPSLEVLPSSLVLGQVGDSLSTTSLQDTTIFCFTKGVQDQSLYNFKWFKRAHGDPPELNQEILFDQGPESIEMLELPVGSLLRLQEIKTSALYTCQAIMNNTSSHLEVAVYLIPESQLRTTTCQPKHTDLGSWPVARLRTTVRVPCPADDVGYMSRECLSRNSFKSEYAGVWGPINQNECVTRNLLEVKEYLETFKSGYVDPNRRDILWITIVKSLYNETHYITIPRLQEWKLFLQILQECLSYLRNLDEGDRIGQSRWEATRQISINMDHKKQVTNITNIAAFFKTIKYLLENLASLDNSVYSQEGDIHLIRSQLFSIHQLLRWHSLLLGRGLSDTARLPSFNIPPHAVVHVNKVNLSQVTEETDLFLVNKTSSYYIGVQVFLRSPQVKRPSNSNKSVIMSVIVIDKLKTFVQISKDPLKANFAVASNLVTVALEEVEKGGEMFVLRDMISLENSYEFKIVFDNYKLNITNQSEIDARRKLQCGQMYKGRLMIRNSTNCRLEYTISRFDPGERVPACLCKSAGTYGLLEVLPSIPHSLVPDQLPLMPVIYGCLTSLILSFLSWSLLVRSCKQSPKKFNTVYKIFTSFSVFTSSLLFVLQLNHVFPAPWTHFASCLLQVTMLTGLSSQLGMGIHLLSEFNLINSSRLSHTLLCLLSCSGPTLVVSILSAGCNSPDNINGDWWVIVGEYHFSSYISVLVLLLVSLTVILGLLWYLMMVRHGGQEYGGHDYGGCDNSAAGASVLPEHRATLKRMILVSVILVLYNVSSILFVNWRDSLQQLAGFAFSIISVLLGFAIILCYIHSETYILVSCGEKTQDEYFKSHDVHMRGSRSDSGSSRLTTSSSVFQQRYNTKVNKKESLQRVSDIEEVLYEDPDLHNEERIYPLHPISTSLSTNNHNIPGFVSTLPNSPPRNPPPLPKRAKCYLKDLSVSPTTSGQPLPPFPPPSFLPPSVPSVSKEPEPLDIVIGRASKEQSGKIPLSAHIAGSGSVSTEITSSSRTTLSLATSLESEYVPPHNQTSPSPVTARLARAYGGLTYDLECAQDGDNQHEFQTMVLARSKFCDNYTEMASPLSPVSQISQTESIADMMARESSGLSKSASSNPSQVTHRESEYSMYGPTPTQNFHSPTGLSCKENLTDKAAILSPHFCRSDLASPAGWCPQQNQSRDGKPSEFKLEDDISQDFLNVSSHQLPDYLNADRGALLSAILALKKKGIPVTAAEAGTSSLSVKNLQEPKHLPTRSTRALSTPTPNIFQTQDPSQATSSTRIFENILTDTLSVSAQNISTHNLPAHGVSPAHNFGAHHVLSADSMAAHNVSASNLVGGGGLATEERRKILKKIQSASEICSGSSELAQNSKSLNEAIVKSFPSEVDLKKLVE